MRLPPTPTRSRGRSALLALAIAATAAAGAGCSALEDGSESDGLQVAAAFYPLHFATSRVAGEHATVDNLTQPGGEPHDLELSVRETAVLADADLLVLLSGFQPVVDEAVDDTGTGEVLDVAEVVDLAVPEEGHAADDGHDHADDIDPHFWHDPLLVADLGDAVAEALGEVDESHAEDYAANAAALRADLEALDREYSDGLSGCERDTVVVSHDAFGYLERYGLHFEPIAGLTPGAEPTPADLARLQELIREEGITTVFSERLASARMAESLAEDVGVETAVLDPLEGLSEETEGEDYLSLMEANLAALQEANGCG